MKYVKSFTEISKKDVQLFGGKVASLGEMLGAGIPIPEGFGISVEAYKDFNNQPFPEDFKKELAEAFSNLKTERVAVRSSAIAEDSSGASWAGQLETFLNVGETDLENAIRNCWRSIESDNVKSYTKDKTLDDDDLLVGVGIQKMIDSDSAGVLFTANPVTGSDTEMIIESAYGLGEMVVQGAVTPDRFIVDTNTMTVTDFNVSIKKNMMVYQNSENVIIPVPESKVDKTSLWEDKIIELAQLGLQIQDHYGVPLDIEWAIYDETFYILQSRPITTLDSR